MNINLVYEGKDYNFDIPNGVTIDYLKELSSKIFNSEKELLDLVYNNEKFSIDDNNTLIRDLIPEGETNAVLTVQINRNLKNKSKNDSKKLIPLVNLKQKNIEKTIINEASDENIKIENNKNEKKVEKKKTLILYSKKEKEKEKEIKVNENKNMNQNEKEYKSINNFKANRDINSNNFRTNLKNNKLRLVFNGVGGKILDNSFKNNLKEKEFSKKLIFESAYIKKNNELLFLIKEFNERIKKLYFILYKNYKNSGLTSNNLSSFSSNNTSRSTINLSINNNYYYELALYEKKLINFLEKQIQFYKSILEIIKKYDNNVTFNQLTEFYNKLIAYNYIDNANIEKLKPIKLTRGPSKKLINSNSSINLSILNSNNNKTNKLPIINNKNTNSPVTQEKSRNALLGNNNGINSLKTNNSINYKQINENLNMENKNKLTKSINYIEMKNSKLKQNNYNEDANLLTPTHNINNSMNKNKPFSKNASNNNIINNIDSMSEKSSDENKSNNALNNIKINNSNNKGINNISPIHLKRRGSLSNIKISKLSNEKDNGNNTNDEKFIFRSSIRNMNKLKNPLGKAVILEDFRKNDNNNKTKKDKKIKDINISSMTVNDSNFAREKHFTPKKNKKNCINKYDFLV